MFKGGSSRILPILIIIVVVIVAILALVTLGRAIFGNRDANSEPESSPARSALLTTDADHSVRMTVRGPLVADENFRSYQIDVSPLGRKLTTYRGYGVQQLDNQELSNTTEAYVEFVHALEHSNFLREEELSGDEDDTRGICAAGRLYTFEVTQAQSTVKRLWTSSCREAVGSFRGNAERVRKLFLDQVPDGDALLRAIDLSL